MCCPSLYTTGLYFHIYEKVNLFAKLFTKFYQIRMEDSDEYELVYSDDESESENEMLVEIELSTYFPISNKGHDSFSRDEISRKFEILADDVEYQRTQGILPECSRITKELLIRFNFDISNVLRIFRLDKENRKTEIEKEIRITEPRRDYDPPEANDDNDCAICYDNDTSELQVGTGFCDHFTCLTCLQTYLETKMDDTVIRCMTCKSIFSDKHLRIYWPEDNTRNYKGIQKIETDQVIMSAKSTLSLKMVYI